MEKKLTTKKKTINANEDLIQARKESMKKFNEYILETKVLANQIQNASPNEQISQTLEKVESIKAESIQYIKKSNELRP